MQRINILVSLVMCAAAHGAQPDAPLTHPVPSIFESIANQPVVLPEMTSESESDGTPVSELVDPITDAAPADAATVGNDVEPTVTEHEPDTVATVPIVGPSPSLDFGTYETDATDADDVSGAVNPAGVGPEREAAPTELELATTSATSLPVPAHEQRLLPPPSVTPEPETVAEDEASNAAMLIPSDLMTWLRVGGALAIVIALILLLRFVVSRVGGPLAGGRAPSGLLDVLARYPIGRGRSIVILKVDRRILVLHQTAEAANTLTEFTDGDEVAALLRKIADANGESTNRKFEAMLSKKKAEGILEDKRSNRRRKRSTQDASGNQAEGLIDIVDLTKQPRLGTVIA